MHNEKLLSQVAIKDSEIKDKNKMIIKLNQRMDNLNTKNKELG